jgi:hypothetical protein
MNQQRDQHDLALVGRRGLHHCDLVLTGAFAHKPVAREARGIIGAD